MSDVTEATTTEVTGEGSPLLQVLTASLQLSGKLDMVQGTWWEYSGFDKVATALADEYKKLVKLHQDLLPRMQTASEDLQERFKNLETAMAGLERTKVTNTKTARTDHKALVAAQVKDANAISGDLDAADKAAAEALRRQQVATAATADKQKALAADKVTMSGLTDRAALWAGMDVGGVEIRGAAAMANSLKACNAQIGQNHPLTDKLKQRLVDFETIDEDYKAKALAEGQRKAAKKIDDDWLGALATAKTAAEKWNANEDIKEALDILGHGNKLKAEQTKLGRAANAVIAFPPAKPDHDGLKTAVRTMNDIGATVLSTAQACVGTRDADVAAAVQALTSAAPEPGVEPKFEKDWKVAVAKIPGLLDEVRALYRAAHKDTPPQVERRQRQAATKQGEVDKFLTVGGWMRQCGLGGTPKTGPNGTVFLGKASSPIDGCKTHFSQFAANATVPASGTSATLAQAMTALFGITSPAICPHLTLERVPEFGSADNARLYTSGRFSPGNIPPDQQVAIKAKMQAQLNHMMTVIGSRISDVLV